MSRSRWCAKVPSRLRSGVAGPRLSRLVCLVSAATLGLVASTRIAQAQEEPLLRLTWQAPRSCPDERTVQQEIRALLPKRARKQSQLGATGQVVRKAGLYHLRLSLRDGEFESEQEFAGESCRDVVGAAAVSIALLLQSSDPQGQSARESEPESERSEDSPRLPPDGGAPEDARKKALEPRTERLVKHPMGSREHASASHPDGGANAPLPKRMVLMLPAIDASIGLLPEPSWGMGGGAGLEVDRLQILVTGWWTWNPSGPTSDTQPATTTHLEHARIAARLCYWWGGPRLDLGPCLDLTVEHLAARADGPDIAPRPRSTTWVASGPAVSARLFTHGSMAASAHLGLHVQSSRPVLVVDGLGRLGQIGRLNLTGTLGTEWIF